MSILDVGCGNARFRDFIKDRIPVEIRYLGVDASLPLLAEARESQSGPPFVDTSLIAADLVTEMSLRCPRTLRFDLAVAFGLLHHIPSRSARRALLSDLASCLRPGGLLAVSFWQFGMHRRYLRRSISWDDYNRQAAEPIAESELDEGDMLLAWGESSSRELPTPGQSVRYCHFANPAEAEGLLDSLSLELIESFSSDGEGGSQNLYYLLRMPQDGCR